jgi:hypothetical protein
VTFARGVFLSAGLIGVVFVLPHYFLEARIGHDYPPPITHPEYYYGFAGVTLTWQILFLVIARDPVRWRPIMLLAILEKVSYGLAVPMLFAAHRVSPLVFGTGLIDLGWAVLFAIAYGKTPSPLSA